MPILTTDLVLRLSGGASNSDPALSLGGTKSSAAYPSGIFDDVATGEAASGDSEFRCVYVHNAHSTLTALATKIWIQSNTPHAGTAVLIGLGSSGLNGTEQVVANEGTAPTGVVFSSPANEGEALSIGNVPPGQHFAIWIRRDVTAGAAVGSDSFTLRVKCDTLP